MGWRNIFVGYWARFKVRKGVPGLNRRLKGVDYNKAQRLCNSLPNDEELNDDSYKRIEYHAQCLLEIIGRYDLLEFLGLHNAHVHFSLLAGTVLFGTDDEKPVYRRTKPTAIKNLCERDDVHGHIYVVTVDGLQAYEFQDGKAPDFSGRNLNECLQAFVCYVKQNKLEKLIGLQVRYKDLNRPVTWECFEGQESVMIDATTAAGLGYEPGRTTGWVGRRNEDGQVESTGAELHYLDINKKRQCYFDSKL